MKKNSYSQPQLNIECYILKDTVTASLEIEPNYDHADNGVTVSGGGLRVYGDSLVPSYYT